MAKFDASIARKATGGLLAKMEVEQNPVEQRGAFYREYFDLESREPIAFDLITTRIKKRFSEMDKLSVMVMLDLYFVHQNWSSFYNREDSFQKYLSEDIRISKTHAYGILNSVAMLEDYLERTGKSSTTGETTFLEEIAESIEKIGIKKLRVLSCVRDNDLRYGILDRLFDGERLSADKIKKLVTERKIIPKARPAFEVKVTGTDVSIDGTDILVFKKADDGLRIAILKAVKSYYRKKAKGI